MIQNSLLRLVEELERDDCLESGKQKSNHEDGPGELRRRIEMLDLLEAGLDGSATVESALRQRAKIQQARLESSNRAVYESIRQDIRRGAGTSGPGLSSLQKWIPDWHIFANSSYGTHYDYLDELIGGVFFSGEPTAALVRLEEDMVPYQPTPARHILDLIVQATPGEQDVFIDLGSGLGQVPILVSICTGAKCVGIEIEPSYVDYARKIAADLGLSRVLSLGVDKVTFVRADARSADLSTGSIFYLYTPFTGAILRDVLDHLRREASTRAVRICTYGPCAQLVAQENWLNATGPADPGRITIFHPRL
ncbi:MAG TPA: class I SAM-dependent methyltransferase [Candidatus Angelobacter sp.]|nr:class I SAM-dependent methyltransferase [Candidatus Angelobacter sp.]